MLETLLGVSITSPGAATIRIQPPLLADRTGLHRVRGSAPTQRGKVEVGWLRVRARTTLDIDVPVNVEATVALPARHGERYIAAGAGAPRFEGVRDGLAVYTVGSGRTLFIPRP